jgi:uncharacterized protein (TIGR03382 family)
VALLAALLSAAPAQAFQQTRDANTGMGLHWTTPTVPWFLNTCRPASSPSCQASGSADPAAAAVQAAFHTWETATRSGDPASCSGIALPYAGTSSSVTVGAKTPSQHLVVFRQGWCSSNPDAVADPCDGAGTCDNKYNCFDDIHGGMSRNVLALTTVMYVPSTGEIADADMEIVDWGGLSGSLASSSSLTDGWYWTCFDPGGAPTCSSYGQDGCAFMDVQNTVTHEAGHFIGLAHPCESDSANAQQNGVPLCSAHPEMEPTTMFPSASPREISKRTLDPDDVDGVCTIYPAPAAAALAPTAGLAVVTSGVTQANAFMCVPAPAKSKSSSGGCGSGSATPGGLAALALALVLLLPRRHAARR